MGEKCSQMVETQILYLVDFVQDIDCMADLDYSFVLDYTALGYNYWDFVQDYQILYCIGLDCSCKVVLGCSALGYQALDYMENYSAGLDYKKVLDYIDLVLEDYIVIRIGQKQRLPIIAKLKASFWWMYRKPVTK